MWSEKSSPYPFPLKINRRLLTVLAWVAFIAYLTHSTLAQTLRVGSYYLYERLICHHHQRLNIFFHLPLRVFNQGCPLSPLLYVLSIEVLAKCAHTSPSASLPPLRAKRKVFFTYFFMSSFDMQPRNALLAGHSRHSR